MILPAALVPFVEESRVEEAIEESFDKVFMEKPLIEKLLRNLMLCEQKEGDTLFHLLTQIFLF